eukprot:TRINITY_DN388_c0_g1_i1.p1 TRINITY_DN388_c0_g1~~TRINITY_DN388_c0_g1_i1.p1  ORF type:complete len:2462 (-),score=309.59 TRINITY_DN388_c0_g1_i1:671-8056(-)
MQVTSWILLYWLSQYSSCPTLPQSTPASMQKLHEKFAATRKLREFTRPLRFSAPREPIFQMLAHYKATEEGTSSTTTLLKYTEEEVQEFSLEEAERELEAQQEEQSIGASIYTFVPFEDTIKSYMNKKKWIWTCTYPCVLKGFVSLLAKQRYREGFVLVNAHRENIVFVKEEKVRDCSVEGAGRILLFYIIAYDSAKAPSVETELYIEKKDAMTLSFRYTGAFEAVCEEIYRVDTEISKIIWSYNYIKRECLQKCMERKQNSLKYCGFFFDTADDSVSEQFLIKVYTTLLRCYKMYSEKKYKEIVSGEKENMLIKVNEGFAIDPAFLYQNSALLDTQKLLTLESDKIFKLNGEVLEVEKYEDIISQLKKGISKILVDFADTVLDMTEEEKLYAKIVSKKQIVLIAVAPSLNNKDTVIEYKQLSKDSFGIFDTMLMGHEEKRRQSSKKEKHKENVKDELIIQLLEETELGFEIFSDPEVHNVNFEMCLFKVVKNFEFYLAEEYNNLLLSFAYDLVCNGYLLAAEIFEKIFDNSHKFTFTFNLTPIYDLLSSDNAGELLNSKLKEFLGTFFKELTPGYYYYFPKSPSSYTKTDKALLEELEGLFGGLKGTDRLPLFIKLNAVYKNKNEVLDTKLIHNFSDIFDQTGEFDTILLQVVAHLVGTHKEYTGERYYEKRDIEDPIQTEDYYEQFAEGVPNFENTLFCIVNREEETLPQITINMDAYLDEHEQDGGILYPFQGRVFLQLIPDNYSKGGFVFSLNDEYARALYSAVRPIKAFLSELALEQITKLPISTINSDVMRYIRLKMGELYQSEIKRQSHRIFFVDYSEMALDIFASELDSMKYNLRRVDSYYYVVWNEFSNETLYLEDDYSKKIVIGDPDQNYKVKYWTLLSFSLHRDVINMQLTINFGFAENHPEDTNRNVKLVFEKAFGKISTRVNQQILLIQLNLTKECPDRLFPLSKKHIVPTTDKKDKERRGTIRGRLSRIYETPNKDRPNRKSTITYVEKEQPDSASKLYTPDLLFTKEIHVNDRVSIKNLADPRYRFLDPFVVLNRKYMYVLSKDKSIYVLQFSERRSELMQKQNSDKKDRILIMDLYGIEQLDTEFIDNLMITVERQLMMIALMKIAQNITFSSGLLSIYDYSFLAQSKRKVDLLFPFEVVTDWYAFMKYVAQNLKKFMITCKFEMGNKKCFSLGGNDKPYYMVNDVPLILESPVYGRVEKFIIGKDDPDFTLVFNFMNEVNKSCLGQIFGKGLCLLNIEVVKLIGEGNIEELAADKTLLEKGTEQTMNRYVALSKYKKNTSWVEYVSLFDDDLKVTGEIGNETPFGYPVIVKRTNEAIEVDAKTYKEIFGATRHEKYLKMELSIKGLLNTEEFITSLILYTNQALADYLTEKAFELFEIATRATLASYTLTKDEKRTLLLKHLNHMHDSMQKTHAFARELKSPLFYHTETTVSLQYRNHIFLITKLISEVCTKVLLANLPLFQIESLCLFLVVTIINNSDNSIEKSYVIKNVQNHESLYAFLRKTLTFQNVEMRNCSVQYQFFVLSKAIPELSSVFTTFNNTDSKVIFVDCCEKSSSDLYSRNRRLKQQNVDSAASDILLPSFSEETMDEILGPIKAQQNILIRSACHAIPRTVFMEILVAKGEMAVNAYNFNKKSIENIERIVSNTVVLNNKRSEVLTSVLVKKLGILSAKGETDELEESIERANSMPAIPAQDVMREVVTSALHSKPLTDLNQFSLQEKSAIFRGTILGDQAFGEMSESQYKNGNEYSVGLSNIPSSVFLQEKNGNLAHGSLSEVDIETGYCPPDSMKLVEKEAKLYNDVSSSKQALKYLCTSPLYFHMVNTQFKAEMYKKYQERFIDRLQFYAKYTFGVMTEMSAEKREHEERLFKYMNLPNVPKKDTAELIASIKSMSSLAFYYTIPCTFTCNTSSYASADTGEIASDPIVSKKAYIKIFNDYFSGLCEMIKAHCGVSEIFLANINPNLAAVEYLNSDYSNGQRTYLGKLGTQYLEPLQEEQPPRWRKVTSSSSLSSKKDSIIERDERYYMLSPEALCKSSAHKLIPVKGFKLKECKAYFLTVAQNAAYIIELECMQSLTEVKVWVLSELLGTEHLPSIDRIYLGEFEKMQESSSLQVEHALNNTVGNLKMDVFNYDVHVNSFLHILHGCREQKGFLEVVNSFIRYYPEPPRKAKNSVKAVLLSVYMGDLGNNVEDFWKYFVNNSAKYNYKSLYSNQLVFCGLLESETFVDSNTSRKLSKDMEEKKDNTPIIAKRERENSIDIEVVQEIYDKATHKKVMTIHKKSNTSSALPQFRRDDSINERGRVVLFKICKVEEGSGGNVRSAGESGSSQKDSQAYQSYAAFALCKNSMESQSVFKREKALKIKEIDEAAIFDENVFKVYLNNAQQRNKLEIQLCGIQAVALRAEDYSRLTDSVPPKIQYQEIEVPFPSPQNIGHAVRKAERVQKTLHK